MSPLIHRNIHINSNFRYFPKGGGFCKINVRPIKFLNAVKQVEFGNVNEYFGWCFVAGSLPIHVIFNFNLSKQKKMSENSLFFFS